MLNKAIPFIFVFLWSTGFIGAKYGLPYASTGDFLTIRTLLNIVSFLCIMVLLKPKGLSRQQIKHALITGILVHGAYLSGVFGAIELGVSAGVSAILVGLQPLLTVLITYSFLSYKFNGKVLVALVLGLVGIYCVVANQVNWHSVSVMGLCFCIVALFGITVGTIYQKNYCAEQPLITSVFWQYMGSLLVFIPIMLLTDSTTIQWNVTFVFALAWLVLGLSIAAILLLMYMIEHGESTKVSSYFYLVPPLASFEAWLLFDETFSLLGLTGMLLCTFSVFLIIGNKEQGKAE